MAYNPGVADRSGELLAAGISKAGSSIADGIRTAGERKQESQASDSVMDFIARTNPELLPKGEDGQPDMAFLEKFYSGNLKTKQQTLGVLATQMLSPLQKAQVRYYDAQSDALGITGAPAAKPVAGSGGGTWGKWGALMSGGDGATTDGALPTTDPLQAPPAPMATPFGMPGIPGGMPVGAPAVEAPPLGLPPLTGPGAVPISSANRAAVYGPPPMGMRR